MSEDQLQSLRDRARAHQAEIDLALVYLTVQDLAGRWNIAESTVRDIPRDQLPYMEFGRKRLKRRRYHPDDVSAFEQRSSRRIRQE